MKFALTFAGWLITSAMVLLVTATPLAHAIQAFA